jgi:DNA-binding MarR family transcriptional regulator
MKKGIPLPCMCANVRRAARVMTQIYDEALRPEGLRSTQFSILQALSIAAPILQGELGELLALDPTAVTRTVQLLRKRGWIKVAPGKDRRERWLSLSAAGEAELGRVNALWETAQSDVKRRLGRERWNQLLALSIEIAKMAAVPE